MKHFSFKTISWFELMNNLKTLYVSKKGYLLQFEKQSNVLLRIAVKFKDILTYFQSVYWTWLFDDMIDKADKIYVFAWKLLNVLMFSLELPS